MAGLEDNYQIKLARLIAAGKIPKDAGLNHIAIYHDDWCGVYSSQRCNCDPDIKYLGDQPPQGDN